MIKNINANILIIANQMLTLGKPYLSPMNVVIDRPKIVPEDTPKITLFVFFGDTSDIMVNEILITEEYRNAGISLNAKAK